MSNPVRASAVSGGALLLTGGPATLAGEVTQTPSLLSYGGKLTEAGNLVLTPVIASNAYCVRYHLEQITLVVDRSHHLRRLRSNCPGPIIESSMRFTPNL